MRCEVRARSGQEWCAGKRAVLQEESDCERTERGRIGLEVWEADREKETKTGREERMRREREGADGASLFETKGGSIAKSAVFNQLVMIC